MSILGLSHYCGLGTNNLSGFTDLQLERNFTSGWILNLNVSHIWFTWYLDQILDFPLMLGWNKALEALRIGWILFCMWVGQELRGGAEERVFGAEFLPPSQVLTFKSQHPGTQNVAVFGDGVFNKVIKGEWGLSVGSDPTWQGSL